MKTIMEMETIIPMADLVINNGNLEKGSELLIVQNLLFNILLSK